MTINSFTIEYNPINSQNIFTNGDSIAGRVIVATSGYSKITSITFAALGKASVCWTEHYGQFIMIVYRASEKYFKIEHNLLRGPETIGPGRHAFPFTFKIPDRDMPSTFKGSIGKVKYSLKAKLSRSAKVPCTAKTKFIFVSKANMAFPRLMEPQYACKDKDIVFFASGNIAMDVFIEKMGFLQGEALNVTVEITNSSTRTVKPKFILYEKKSFFARGRRRLNTKDVLKDKDEAVTTSSQKTISKMILIPPQLPPSILNCSIIKLEYRLKVILDVALAKNPQIKLPVVVLPNFSWCSSKKNELY